jgi:hypothetical protein
MTIPYTFAGSTGSIPLSYLDANFSYVGDSSGVVYTPAGTGAVSTTVQAKLQERKSINDCGGTLAAAFINLGGAEGTGYNTAQVELDLLGGTYSFTGTLYVPTNISLVNGTINGTSTHKLVFRNPYLANTSLRGYTLYWPYMTSVNRGVTFNCLTVNNCYIGLRFTDCGFDGASSALVHVNSNSLWTEYTTFEGACRFSANASVGAAILFDGNLSGTSTYSTGSGAGANSFGYTSFGVGCKIDSTAPQVGIKLVDGAVLYNSNLAFKGYARGAGPSGGFLYADSSLNACQIGYCNFNVHLESFGAAANILSLSNLTQFWYNTGSIQSASPQMVMAQGGTADLRANNISVIGVVLQDSNGSVVFNGPSYMTTLVVDVNKRVWSIPAFGAYPTSNQSYNSNVISKVTLGSVEFDTNTNFSTSRFSPNVAGYYQINAQLKIAATGTALAAAVHIYKNGAAYRTNDVGTLGASMIRAIASIVYMNGTTDYLEMYAYTFDNAGAPQVVSGSANTFLNGCLVRVA